MQSEVDVVTVTVGDEEVFPILQTVTSETEGCRETEVVVWPCETLTPTDGSTKHLQVFVWVVVRTVVVVVGTIVITHTVEHGVVAVHVAAIIVVRTDVCIFRIESRYRERVRTFATKPRVVERNVVLLIVATIGGSTDFKLLGITLRQDTTALRSLAEEVAHGEVGELDTSLQNHTCVTITEGEFQLVACLWHKSEVEVHGSVVRVWLWLEVDLLRVEVSHLMESPSTFISVGST